MSAAATSERFALDGYRALAAVAVMTFHAYQFNRGSRWPLEGTVWHEVLMNSDLAVDLFFVLSGLVLGLPFARAALGRSPARSARMFLLRRFARLLPLYVTVVLVVWSISNPDLPGDWRDLLLHLSFTQVYSDDRIFYTVGPAWTLACEVHFYLLLAVLGPLAQRGCARLRSTGARYALMVGGIAVLMAVSITWRVWAADVAHIPVTSWATWFNPLAKLDVFAIGLLLGVVAASGRKIVSGWGRAAVVLAAAAVFGVAVVTRSAEDEVDVFQHTLAGLAIALLFAATALAPTQPRWLQWRPVAFLGTVSFGLYLWQEPVQRLLAANGLLPAHQPGPMFLVAAASVFAVTVVVAFVSYHVIERTGLRVLSALDSGGRHRVYHPEPGPPPAPLVRAE